MMVDNHYHPTNSFRPSRSACLSIGLAMGAVMGALLCMGVNAVLDSRRRAQAERPSWRTDQLVFKSADNGRYFIENRTRADVWFRDPRELVIMQATPAGLVLSDKTPTLPVYLPSGETAAIVLPDGGGQYILFDLAQRRKIALEAQ